MDICDCKDATVRNCLVLSEDDGICLKSHGRRGLENILVENNRITSFRANAIKLGTSTSGPVSRLVFRNNIIDFAKYAGLCIESVDGSAVRDVTVKGLEMHQVAQPLFIRLACRGKNVKTPDPKAMARSPGSIDGVVIEGLHAVNGHKMTLPSCSITGIPGAEVRNVTLRNCSFEMPGGLTKVPGLPPKHEGDYPQSNIVGNPPAYGLFIRHASGINLENVSFGKQIPDVRPWIAISEATVSTNGCRDMGLLYGGSK
jgi:hypothetical protein